MPVATAANSFLVGLHTESSETTASATPAYSMAVYSADAGPVEALNRIEITDASSIIGDPYKGPQSWASTFETPAYSASLGTILTGLYPTDTYTPGTPSTHAFSGLGGTQLWQSVYTEWTNAGAKEFTGSKGLCTGITFSASNEGGPLRVSASHVGQSWAVTGWTASAADNLDDGYLQMQATGAKFELDVDTPNSNPSTQPEKIRNFSLSITRGITPEPVVDSFPVTVLGQGKVEFAFSAELLWTSWDAYQATYFGAVGGTSASETIVYGAAEMTFKHSTAATHEFRIYIPKIAFRVTNPTPDASGGPIVLAVTGEIAKPSSGDHVQPTLLNSVASEY